MQPTTHAARHRIDEFVIAGDGLAALLASETCFRFAAVVNTDFLALKERDDFGLGAFQPCHEIIRQWLLRRQFYAAFPQGNASAAVLDKRD